MLRWCLADDDRTHLLFSLLDGLRLVIPQFVRDPSETGRPTSVLIPGVYYVFYKPPEPTAGKPAMWTVTKSAMDQRQVASAKSDAKSRTKTDYEPLEGLYDRRQVKRKQEVMKDRRHLLSTRRPRSATSAFPIFYVGDMTYILSPNTEIITSLTPSAK